MTNRIRLAAGRFVVCMAAFALAPGHATADPTGTRDFGILCTASQFRACASVRAWNETDPSTGSLLLFIQVANVQGWAGYEDAAVAGIEHLAFSGLELDNYTPNGFSFWERVDDWSSFGIGGFGTFACGPSGCAEGGVVVGKEVAASEPGTTAAFSFNPAQDSELLIRGCDVNTQTYFGGWSTCGGRVTYTVSLGFGAGLALGENTAVAIQFADYPGFARCGTGGQPGYAPCEVVPEPITVVLLGSGLAGVAAVRRRRREDEGA